MSTSTSRTIVPTTVDHVLGTAAEGAIRAGAGLIDAGEVATTVAAMTGRAAIDGSSPVGSAVADTAAELAEVATRRVRTRHVVVLLALVVGSGGAIWWSRRSATVDDESTSSSSAVAAVRPDA